MPPKKAPYYGRKTKSSISIAVQRRAETEEQREKRLKNVRIISAARRAAESVEKRKERLKKHREYMAAVRAVETQKQRRLRILQQEEAYEAAEKATRKPEEEQRQEVSLNILQCLKKRNLSKRKNSQCQKVERAMVSSENDPLQQPTAPRKFQTKQVDETNLLQKNQFENSYVGKRQMFAGQPARVAVPPTSKRVQVLGPPSQKVEPKPVQKHQPQLKKVLLIVNHRHLIMSNLSSLWKNRKLCDAGLSNGTSTVKVHKVVLSAVCPKLLSVFGTDILSHEFLQVNFPKEVSTEALNAFAEYMYNGILDLDIEILKQLKIIAKKLDMNEFEQLCASRLPNDFPQSANAAKLPMIQKVKSVPAMTSSLASLDSPVTMDYTPSAPTRVININQESMEVDLGQVKMEMGPMFCQEMEVESLAASKSGNDVRFVICPNIKTEPVRPDDNKYGHLSSSSNQVFTSTMSSSSSATAASTSIPSVSVSSTEFPIPFSQSTYVKSTRLKANPSYKTPLVSDLSPISRIDETACSQFSAMNKNSSKQLISTSSLQLPSTSNNNAGVYPVELFMARGDNLPLLTPIAKPIDLYKTELT